MDSGGGGERGAGPYVEPYVEPSLILPPVSSGRIWRWLLPVWGPSACVGACHLLLLLPAHDGHDGPLQSSLKAALLTATARLDATAPLASN